MRAVASMALATMLLAGCGDPETSMACRDGAACGSGRACFAGTCVPRLTGGMWNVELWPRVDSLWAPSEAAVGFAGGPVALRVEPKITLFGGFQREPQEASLPTAIARVSLFVASVLPTGERRFETHATSGQPGAPVEFSLDLPESVTGQAARVRVVPTAPFDRQVAPWTAAIASLSPRQVLSIPRVTDQHIVDGTLFTGLGDPARDYAARALLGDRVVSNTAQTDAEGKFRLRIPRDATNPVDLAEVLVEVAPVDGAVPKPRLITRLPEGAANLMLRLPTDSLAPRAHKIPVLAAGRPVAGATLRFHARLPGATGAEAFFGREAQTDSAGVATPQLLPAPAGATRDYAVAVIPPADSEWAGRCVPQYSVAATASAEPRVGAAIELVRRMELSGRIASAEGSPLAGVRITASRREDETVAPACATTLAATPTSSTTDAQGEYRLFLDRGHYRLDYEPPRASAVPLWSERDVAVDRNSRRDVTLPPGALGEGLVHTPSDEPLPGCTVRVTDASGLVVGRALTGPDGRFFLVLPRP